MISNALKKILMPWHTMKRRTIERRMRLLLSLFFFIRWIWGFIIAFRVTLKYIKNMHCKKSFFSTFVSVEWKTIHLMLTLGDPAPLKMTKPSPPPCLECGQSHLYQHQATNATGRGKQALSQGFGLCQPLGYPGKKGSIIVLGMICLTGNES